MDKELHKFEKFGFSYQWFPEGNYLRVNFWGDHGLVEANKFKEEMEKIFQQIKHKFFIFNDLRKGETATKDAMDVYAKMLVNPQIEKHAFLVPESGPVVIIPDLLIKMSGITNAMLFHDQEQLMDYLKK